MAENSSIEWTDHTFNPWRGCRKVSPACKFCYAETRGNRFGEDFSGQRIVLSDAGWKDPLKWNKKAEADGVRRKVFCASLADVFEDWGGPMVDPQGDEKSVCYGCGKIEVNTTGHNCDCGDYKSNRMPRKATMSDVRRRLFELIDATPHLDWLLLTKRPENIRKMWGEAGTPHSQDWPRTNKETRHRRNVWLGTTVENQEQAEKRIPELLKCRDLSPTLFLSCEPLLGPLDISRRLPCECAGEPNQGWAHAGQSAPADGVWKVCRDCKGDPVSTRSIDWVIAGGESGTNARPSHPDWFRGLRDQCESAGVPFHFKQWGEWYPLHGTGRPNTDEESEITPFCWVSPRGDVTVSGTQPDACMVRVGKKKAGRLLDGVEHNGVPLGELWITKNV